MAVVIAGPVGDGTRHRDFVAHLLQRTQELVGRDHLHVLAYRRPVHRLEDHQRIGLAQLVQHARLRGHQHLRGGGVARCVDHPGRGQDLGSLRWHDACAGQVQRTGGTPALGVDEQLGIGFGLDAFAQVGPVDAGVHVAFAHPDVHVLPAGDPLHVCPEELIGAEQDLPIRRDRGHHIDGIRRSAADVGLGLHRCGGVDVADDRSSRVLRLPLAQLLGCDGLGEAAAGALVGDQHRFVVAQDLRRLGHEVHAAEHDDRGIDFGGHPRQRQRITHVVGDVLDLGQLVVVGEDHGVAPKGQLAHLVGPCLGGGHGHRLRSGASTTQWLFTDSRTAAHDDSVRNPCQTAASWIPLMPAAAKPRASTTCSGSCSNRTALPVPEPATTVTIRARRRPGRTPGRSGPTSGGQAQHDNVSTAASCWQASNPARPSTSDVASPSPPTKIRRAPQPSGSPSTATSISSRP
jgi:hypothetical protein